MLPVRHPVRHNGEFFERRREDHENFFCPNGHPQHFPAETEAEKLRRALDDEKDRHARTLSRLNLTERRAKKAEKQIARTKKGLCPCCKRFFLDLSRHVATKHPEQLPTKPEGKLP